MACDRQPGTGRLTCSKQGGGGGGRGRNTMRLLYLQNCLSVCVSTPVSPLVVAIHGSGTLLQCGLCNFGACATAASPMRPGLALIETETMRYRQAQVHSVDVSETPSHATLFNGAEAWDSQRKLLIRLVSCAAGVICNMHI